MVGLPFQILDWDSSHFGMRIGRVLAVRGEERLFERAREWADRESLACVYLLAEANDTAAVRLAGDFGWRMVDVRATLEAEKLMVSESHAPVRLARAEDLPYLKRLAISSHRDSRFYTDGGFPTSACDRLFEVWIERSVLDRGFAGAVFVPELDGKPAGYITCAVKNGVGEIGLLAVDPNARRRGVGTGLLQQATNWFSEQGAGRISVVTQGSNVPALRMYERCGYMIESIQLWFHWWRVRPRGVTIPPGGK
jgi:dTDP-4-amino-4,6-dideoxy-D-galactose acyltransferase